jgi:hypothetical protein
MVRRTTLSLHLNGLIVMRKIKQATTTPTQGLISSVITSRVAMAVDLLLQRGVYLAKRTSAMSAQMPFIPPHIVRNTQSAKLCHLVIRNGSLASRIFSLFIILKNFRMVKSSTRYHHRAFQALTSSPRRQILSCIYQPGLQFGPSFAGQIHFLVSWQRPRRQWTPSFGDWRALRRFCNQRRNNFVHPPEAGHDVVPAVYQHHNFREFLHGALQRDSSIFLPPSGAQLIDGARNDTPSGRGRSSQSAGVALCVEPNYHPCREAWGRGRGRCTRIVF